MASVWLEAVGGVGYCISAASEVLYPDKYDTNVEGLFFLLSFLIYKNQDEILELHNWRKSELSSTHNKNQKTKPNNNNKQTNNCYRFRNFVSQATRRNVTIKRKSEPVAHTFKAKDWLWIDEKPDFPPLRFHWWNFHMKKLHCNNCSQSLSSKNSVWISDKTNSPFSSHP